LERLRRIREQAGYSQQALADKSGVSQHTISEIELGRRKPQGRTLRKLAGALGVEIRDLTAVTLREWALATPEEEFTRWLEGASLDEVLTLNRELSAAAQEEAGGSDRHRYIVSRISKVVDRFTKLASPIQQATLWDKSTPTRDDQQGREAG
jgi:transcriptional regulator with XRE-family HTH domain